MIKVRTPNKEYQVPTNFDELTWQQYVKLVKAQKDNVIQRLITATGITEDELLQMSITDFKKICELVNVQNYNVIQRLITATGIAEDELLQMSITDLKKICELVEYTDVLFVAEAYGGLEVELNIGAESYGKLEQARQAIIQAGNWVLSAQKVGLIYLQEDINDYQLPLAMAKIKTVFELLNEFLTKFKKLYEGEVEAEEEIAGVDVFRKFGSFPTIDRLAIAYGKTHDEVLAMPAEVVMTKLLYDLENSEYQERLMKIKSAK